MHCKKKSESGAETQVVELCMISPIVSRVFMHDAIVSARYCMLGPEVLVSGSCGADPKATTSDAAQLGLSAAAISIEVRKQVKTKGAIMHSQVTGYEGHDHVPI